MSDTENRSIASSQTYFETSSSSTHDNKEAKTHIFRQESVDMESPQLIDLDEEWAFVSSSNSSPGRLQRSLTPDPSFGNESPEMNKHSPKHKKDKKKLSSVFKRHKKHKEKHADSQLSSSMSLGSAESRHKFSKLKSHRAVASMDTKRSLLLPPERSRSRHSDYESDASSESELIATLLNPSLAVNRQLSTSAAGSFEHRPPSQLSNVSAPESDQGNLERKVYFVSVTLHSGHNLAIRDKTGSSDPYVKFKCGHFKYRSAVIHRNLNPEWNETFSFRTSHLNVPLVARVFDHDFGSLDDYMGGQSVNLEAYTTSEMHIIDLGLECPVAAARGENLGSIQLFVQVTPVTDGDSQDDKKTTGSHKASKIQMWNKVVTVLLVEGHKLPAMDSNGLSDPYCKLKLGKQSVKSKVIPKCLDPKWMELFGLRLYDGSTTLHLEVWDRDFPHSDDFIGSCSVELSTLKPEVTHRLTLELTGDGNRGEDSGSVSLLVTITGSNVNTESLSMLDMSQIAKKYSLLSTLKIRDRKDLGCLRVRVESAEDLPAADTVAALELGNALRVTQTVYRTTNPTWDKTFEFKVLDIHDELKVCVYKGAKLLGRVKIPLHRIESGECKAYPLKTKDCRERAKGVIWLECELVYNPVRCAIRTINPQEQRYLEEEEKFSRKVLVNNISRVAQLIRTILALVQLYKSFFSWEDKMKSGCAFIIFLIAMLFVEIWMFPLIGAMVFAYCYIVIYMQGKHIWQVNSRLSKKRLSLTSEDEGFSDFSDIEEDLDNNKSRTKLRALFKQLQEILLIIQKVLGVIGDTEERVRNLFNWSIPFLCWMAMVLLVVAGVGLYFIPIRYILLVWGINKFTKRLRNPNYVENNELLDFISRSPTNKQLDQWRVLSTPKTKDSPKMNRKQKSSHSPREKKK